MWVGTGFPTVPEDAQLWFRIPLTELSLRRKENIAHFTVVFRMAYFLLVTFNHVLSFSICLLIPRPPPYSGLDSVVLFTSGKELLVISFSGQSRL